MKIMTQAERDFTENYRSEVDSHFNDNTAYLRIVGIALPSGAR